MEKVASGMVSAVLDHGSIVQVVVRTPPHDAPYFVNFDRRQFGYLIEAEGNIHLRQVDVFADEEGAEFITFDGEA